MRVQRDGREAIHLRDIAQMLAEVRFVDGEIVLERQQHRRNDAVGDKARVPWHGIVSPVYRIDHIVIPSATLRARSHDVLTTGAPGSYRPGALLFQRPVKAPV